MEAQLKDTSTSEGTEAKSDVGGARTRRIPETETHTIVGRAAELPSDVKGRRTFKKQPIADVTEVKEENEKLIDKVTTLEMKVIEKVNIP